MRGFAKHCTFVTLALLIAEAAEAQRDQNPLHVSVTLATDYKLHGLTQTDGDLSARISADYNHRSGFYAGGYLGNVDYAAESQFRTPRDSQLNLYAGYGWRNSRWIANLSVSRYIYPGIDFRYDYTQLAASLSYRDRYFFSASRSDNYLSIDRTAYQYRIGMAVPWIWDLEVGINAGRFESSELFDTGYSFWDIGLSRPMAKFALDLRYHDNTYDRSTILGGYDGDRWVFSLTYAILPRETTDSSR